MYYMWEGIHLLLLYRWIHFSNKKVTAMSKLLLNNRETN